MDVGIIGGADGPTAIFLSSSSSWFNSSGLLFVLLILLPNVFYAVKHPGEKNLCRNKLINTLEQSGRYGCMALMISDFGLFQSGFSSVVAFTLYYAANIVLIALYWFCWFPYWRSRKRGWAVALAVLPALAFFASGVSSGNAALSVLAVLFCVAHVWVTLCNH